MRGESIARNYAAALFELGEREGAAEAYGAGLEAVMRALEEVPELRSLLETPSVARAEKKRVLEEAFGERIHPNVMNFVLLVLDKRRQRLLRAMGHEYRGLLDRKLGRAHVEVALAREPLPEEHDRIAEQLSRILGKTAIPHVRVRPELLGGIVFRSGDVIFDGSVKSRLDRMRRQLLTAGSSAG